MRRISERSFLIWPFILSASLFPGAASAQAPQTKSSATTGTSQSKAQSGQTSAKTRAKISPQSSLRGIPLHFEENRGQTDSRVQYIARGGGYTVFLTPSETVLALRSGRTQPAASSKKKTGPFTRPDTAQKISVLRMKLAGANASPVVLPSDRLPGTVNYFLGRDSRRWHSGIPTYSKIQYLDVYSGIDLVYHSSQNQLEYDFVVNPGADPQKIAFSFEGASAVAMADSGDMHLDSPSGKLTAHKPQIYQLQNGQRKQVSGNFVMRDAHTIGVEVKNYDRTKPLVIDPVLSYSTYLGGSSLDEGDAVAVDQQGNAYIAGDTTSVDFPITGTSISPASTSNTITFVTKLNSSGTGIVYSTYLGGTTSDVPFDLAVDANGYAYVTGLTSSADFPVTTSAYQSSLASDAFRNAFVSKLAADGASLVYSTFLGGGADDEGTGIAVDASGTAYVSGYASSSGFPITASNAYQTALNSPNGNAFLSKIDTTKSGASSLVYSTFLGGTSPSAFADLNAGDFGGDSAYDVAIDSNQNAYIVGEASSTDFPVTSGAFQSQGNAANCAFVSQIDTSKSGAASLVYSTYLCGTDNVYGDYATGIAIDPQNNIYVTGNSSSTDFPTVAGTSSTSATEKPFAAKLNTANAGSASLLYSMRFGGSADDAAWRIASDSVGVAYVTGFTFSTDFPVTSDALQSTNQNPGNSSGFLAAFNPTGSALLYATYLGGSSGSGDYVLGVAVDSSGDVFLTGATSASDFPTTSGSFQTGTNGSTDGFVTQISSVVGPPPTISVSAFPPPNAAGWNTTNVTLTYTCTPGSAPIASCPPQRNITSDGANQSFVGTVTDANGLSASATVTLNVERTAPALTVSSPTDQFVSSSQSLAVSGTSANSLTNINSVTCNGANAATSAGAFSCNLSLSPGVNLVMVRATDAAGNVSGVRLHVSYTGALPAPNSLQVSPANANVLVGGTQQFTVVDELGHPRTDATWTVDNSSIATISSDASPTLTGVAAGTVNLIASVGSVTSQIQVNVLSGTSLPVGTVLWSAPSTPGFTLEQIAQAVPTPGGPDLHSIELGNVGGSPVTLVRALTADGRQMWQNSTSAAFSVIPDGFGGIFAQTANGAGESLADLDASTGTQAWTYATSGSFGYTAVKQDGTLFLEEGSAEDSTGSNSASIVALDPTTGAPTLRLPLPSSGGHNVNCHGETYDSGTRASATSNLAIDSDGTVSMEVEVETLVQHFGCADPNPDPVNNPYQQIDAPFNSSLYLFQIKPDGSSTMTPIHSFSGDILLQSLHNRGRSWPQEVIPDGHGGALAAWTDYSVQPALAHITRIGPSGQSDYTFPSLADIFGSMVLGDNNTAYATDTVTIQAFDLNSGQSLWTYQVPDPDNDVADIIAAPVGGGLVAEYADWSVPGNHKTNFVFGLDENGNSTTPTVTERDASYSWKGSWNATVNGALSSINLPPIPLSWGSAWAEPAGSESMIDRATTHHSFGLFWCGAGYGKQGSCTQAPFNVAGADVAFGYVPNPTSTQPNQLQQSQFNFENSHPEWVDLIQSEALKAFRDAFAKFPAISVQIASMGDKSCYWFFTCHGQRLQEHVAFIVGDWGDQGQGGVLLDLGSSRVYYPNLLDSAEDAVTYLGLLGRPAYPPPSQDLPSFLRVLKALGHGIGVTAAHEVGHQLQNDVALPDMECGYDTENPDMHPCEANYNFVINFFNGSGLPQDPSNPNSTGAQFKFVDVPGVAPVRWGARICKSLADYADPGSSSRTACPVN